MAEDEFIKASDLKSGTWVRIKGYAKHAKHDIDNGTRRTWERYDFEGNNILDVAMFIGRFRKFDMDHLVVDGVKKSKKTGEHELWLMFYGDYTQPFFIFPDQAYFERNK